MMHRLGAIVTTVALIWLIVKLRRTIFRPAQRYAILLGIVLLVQLLLGISNIIFALPLAVAVLHNAVGALLLIVVATLNYLVCTARSSDQ